MGLVVTGISQNGDIKALEASIVAAGLSLEPIQLISGGDNGAGYTRRSLSSQIMTGDRSGSVPGLNSRGPSLSSFRSDPGSEQLADLDIPDSEVDNYVEALEAGRSIVAYYAKPTSVTIIEDLFRTSGLAKVKVF